VTEQPPTEATPPEHEGPPADRLDSLESKVDGIVETLKRILHPGDGAPPVAAEPAAEEPDVAAQVKAELAKLKAAEDKKKAAADKDKEFTELKETVAKIQEKPPKEYRKVTNLVWGRDED
jgi:hypothetical protein